MANYVQTEIKSFVDKETGELHQQEVKKKWSCKYKSDSFFRVFLDWVPFEKRLSNQAKSIITWMCAHSEYNTGKVFLPTAIRDKVCSLYNISPNRLTNLLSELRNNGIILGSKGVYIINPELFWIGDQHVRDDMLKDGNIEFTITLQPEEELYKNFLQEHNLEE